MKTSYLILSFILASVILNSCKSPSFIYYSSEANIPQKSNFIKSEIKMVAEKNKRLPFGVLYATDLNSKNEITDYYILLSRPLYIGSNNATYIHPYCITLKPEQFEEILKVLNESIYYSQNKTEKIGVTVLNYSIVKEHNTSKISKNVESWSPDFKFIYKIYNVDLDENEAYLCLGSNTILEQRVSYDYSLSIKELIEFKDRLEAAITELRKLGLK